jgi:hypothetical protein
MFSIIGIVVVTDSGAEPKNKAGVGSQPWKNALAKLSCTLD